MTQAPTTFALPLLVCGFEHWLTELAGVLGALVSGGAAWLQKGLQKAYGALDFVGSVQRKLSAAMAALHSAAERSRWRGSARI